MDSMSEKFVTALNTVSGVVGQVPVDYLTHPHFKDYLVAVKDDAKSYEPTLFQSTTAEEFVAKRASRGKATDEKATIATDNTEGEGE